MIQEIVIFSFVKCSGSSVYCFLVPFIAFHHWPPAVMRPIFCLNFYDFSAVLILCLSYSMYSTNVTHDLCYHRAGPF